MRAYEIVPRIKKLRVVYGKIGGAGLSLLASAACGLPLPLCVSVLLLLLSLKAPTTASISLAPALAPCPRLLRTHNLHRHRHTISLLPLPPLGWCSTTPPPRLFVCLRGRVWLLIALVAGWFVLYDYFRVSVCGSRYSCRIEGTCDLVRERWWLCVSARARIRTPQ